MCSPSQGRRSLPRCAARRAVPQSQLHRAGVEADFAGENPIRLLNPMPASNGDAPRSLVLSSQRDQPGSKPRIRVSRSARVPARPGVADGRPGGGASRCASRRRPAGCARVVGFGARGRLLRRERATEALCAPPRCAWSRRAPCLPPGARRASPGGAPPAGGWRLHPAGAVSATAAGPFSDAGRCLGCYPPPPGALPVPSRGAGYFLISRTPWFRGLDAIRRKPPSSGVDCSAYRVRAPTRPEKPCNRVVMQDTERPNGAEAMRPDTLVAAGKNSRKIKNIQGALKKLNRGVRETAEGRTGDLLSRRSG